MEIYLSKETGNMTQIIFGEFCGVSFVLSDQFAQGVSRFEYDSSTDDA
jgi:hypothetical protein